MPEAEGGGRGREWVEKEQIHCHDNITTNRMPIPNLVVRVVVSAIMLWRKVEREKVFTLVDVWTTAYGLYTSPITYSDGKDTVTESQ